MIGWVTKRAVFEHLHKRILQTANNNCGYVADAGVIISDLADRLQVWLNEMDIVDAVPVVRCKDCKHYKDGECTNTFWGTAEGDFCSEGERNETES